MIDWIWRVVSALAKLRDGECVLVVCKRGGAAFCIYRGEVAPSARILMTHALRDTPEAEVLLPHLYCARHGIVKCGTDRVTAQASQLGPGFTSFGVQHMLPRRDDVCWIVCG